MKTYIELQEPVLEPMALALGNFDGFHKGHMTLLERAKLEAKNRGIAAAVFSFEPHPSFVLAGKDPVDLINTRVEKEAVFSELGMDYHFEYPFTKATAELSPEDFVKVLLLKQLNPQVVIVGDDYHFGRKRLGNVDTLRDLGQRLGFEVVVLPKLLHDGVEISSTWIREAVKKGDVRLANTLMGRPFRVTGIVQHGKKLGRTIGYPTANLLPEPEKLLPKYGVYVTTCQVGGLKRMGMTYVGERPTLHAKGVAVETFLLDFDADIYDNFMIVDFVDYIRGDLTFASMEALKNQIARDVAVVQK